jgi:hypothetical protein
MVCFLSPFLFHIRTRDHPCAAGRPNLLFLLISPRAPASLHATADSGFRGGLPLSPGRRRRCPALVRFRGTRRGRAGEHVGRSEARQARAGHCRPGRRARADRARGRWVHGPAPSPQPLGASASASGRNRTQPFRHWEKSHQCHRKQRVSIHLLARLLN